MKGMRVSMVQVAFLTGSPLLMKWRTDKVMREWRDPKKGGSVDIAIQNKPDVFECKVTSENFIGAII
jgi:hypothetical protein